MITYTSPAGDFLVISAATYCYRASLFLHMLRITFLVYSDIHQALVMSVFDFSTTSL